MLKYQNHSILIQLKHCYSGIGGARGVMVIVEENGHEDTGSYPGRD